MSKLNSQAQVWEVLLAGKTVSGRLGHYKLISGYLHLKTDDRNGWFTCGECFASGQFSIYAPLEIKYLNIYRDGSAIAYNTRESAEKVSHGSESRIAVKFVEVADEC